MFDKAEITVIAGRGGSGVVSFRREKFIPLGGPDGGDGGNGGNVVIRADNNTTSLVYFQYRSVYRAGDGGNGRSQKKHGKNGDDLVLVVPVGVTVLSRAQLGGDTEVCDLTEPDQQVVVVAGGRGGLGNIHFTSSTNQAPCIAQKGEDGEKKELVLELKLIADVGVIGYPNAGKSSLLASASAAKPKIANYPFTTLEPVMGFVEVGQKSFIMAEIPGLIAGAHLGRGLGHDFLRHILRTQVLIHLVDGGSKSPVEDMTGVNAELGLFDSALVWKQQIVAINKIDLPDVRTRITELKEAFGDIGINPLFVSAITGEGVPALMAKALEVLESVTAQRVADSEVPAKVFRPKPKGGNIRVYMEGETFVVQAPGLERIIAGSNLTDPEARRQLNHQLGRPLVKKALEKAGVKPGDKVRCGALEWRW
ncbi:MAG: GTPase ObgE [Dehalococcoidales bacterium]|nr:GTPase ObgE [Dehalococcoidales bacterium]